MVQFIVGPEKELFTIHKSFATHYSPVFKAAFNQYFIEGQTKTYTLDQTNPETFEMFLQWGLQPGHLTFLLNGGKSHPFDAICSSLDLRRRIPDTPAPKRHYGIFQTKLQWEYNMHRATYPPGNLCHDQARSPLRILAAELMATHILKGRSFRRSMKDGTIPQERVADIMD
jgi:hypothetical protein